MQQRSLPALLRLRNGLRSSWRGCEGLQECSRAFSQDTTIPGEVGAVSGAPNDVIKRKVLIYSPARTPTQQGMSKTLGSQNKGSAWKLEFSTQEKWENPLIGWTSTADPLENVARSAMSFKSKEDAAKFCEKYGWEYEIREPHMRRTTRQKRFLGYGDNYSVKRNGLPDGGLISEGTAAPMKEKSTAF